MDTTNTVQRLSADGHATVHVGHNYNTFPEENGDKRSRILQCLYQANDSGTKHANNYESHKERNPRAEPGTCQWFLTSDRYMEWLYSPRSSFLWLTADAGCRKSVLASTVVDELREPNSSTAVCHFFFRDDNPVQADGTFALRALLYQLLLATDVLPPIIAAEYDAKGELAFSDLHNLWKVFISAVGECRSPVFCVLDGLDECDAKTQRKIASYLTEFYQLDNVSNAPTCPENGPILKVFLTARPLNGITTGLGKFDDCRMRGEDFAASVGSDIQLVITKNLGALVDDGFIEPETKDRLHERMLIRHDDTFLWAALVMNQLRERSEDGACEIELINTLDDDSIYAIYASFLDESSQKPTDITLRKCFLQILLTAYRPLTLVEMDYALSIRAEHKCVGELTPYLHTSRERFLKRIGGSFVSLRGQVVRFVHQSAREFLIHRPDGPSINGQVTFGSWYRSLDLHDAHETLALRCVWYLLLSNFANIDIPLDDLETEDRELGVHSLIEKHPFLDYASNYWLLHSQNQGSRALAEHKSTLLCLQDRRFQTWLYVTLNRQPSDIVFQAVIDKLPQNKRAVFSDTWTSFQIAQSNMRNLRDCEAQLASIRSELYCLRSKLTQRVDQFRTLGSYWATLTENPAVN